MAIVAPAPLVTPAPPGYGRAHGRVTVFASRAGATVPLAGATVRPYVPGTETPWPEPLYRGRGRPLPRPVPGGGGRLRGGEPVGGHAGPGRVVLRVPGVRGAGRVVLDLEPPPAAEPRTRPTTTSPGRKATSSYAPLPHLTEEDAHPVSPAPPETCSSGGRTASSCPPSPGQKAPRGNQGNRGRQALGGPAARGTGGRPASTVPGPQGPAGADGAPGAQGPAGPAGVGGAPPGVPPARC